MAHATAVKTPDPQTTHLSVSTLTLSPLNPRQEVDEMGIETLAQSIHACGLLQNLIVFKNGKTHEVVAGGRRLRALKKLIEDKKLAKTAKVAVCITENEAEALNWANAENAARIALTPVQEIRAYRTMADKNMALPDIAKAVGKTERHVKGRMRLAYLPVVILEAVEADKLSVEAAAAFTVSADQNRQVEVYEALKNHWHGPQPHAIKRMLMEESVTDDNKLVLLVGHDAYINEGGNTREDLFSTNTYYLDRDILTRLASTQLETVRQSLEADGWSWVTIGFDGLTWDEKQGFDRLHPFRNELSEEEEATYNMLCDQIDAEEATPEAISKFHALNEKCKEQWTKEQKTVSGCHVYINNDGTLAFDGGLIRADDYERAVETGVLKETKSPKGQTSKTNDGPYSQALTMDLATIRTSAIQTAILSNPKLALDLAIFALSSPIFAGSNPLHISALPVRNEVDGDDGQDLPEELTMMRSAPMDAKTAASGFDAFLELSDDMKTALLCDAVATSFGCGLALNKQTNPLVERIVKNAQPDYRAVWTPTTSFFKRLKADQLDAIAKEIGGFTDAFTRMNKLDKVARLHAVFNNEEDRAGFSKESKERIASWVPKGFMPGNKKAN